MQWFGEGLGGRSNRKIEKEKTLIDGSMNLL
jgi:hypothetical protein